jgi:Uma2 family endonuclease
MDRETFHRLYADCEEYEKVELIEGVVYMPSPEKVPGHAREANLLLRWLNAYVELNPEIPLEAVGGGSILLDNRNEPIPDAMLYRLTPGRFEDGYLAEPPELIAEIAYSSASRDLHQKKAAYERNGVREYIVWRTRTGVLDWFVLRGGRYEQLEPMDGVIESEEFPGLRLDVAGLLGGDRGRVLGSVRVAAR